MSKITENIDAVCELIKQKAQIGFGITSQKASDLKQQIANLEQILAEANVFPADWAHKHSIGVGNLASVVWIVFLPPGQSTQDGIYVSFCFGKAGNGLVTGCAISNTSKKKYSYVPTVERKNPLVDVDGTRPGTHYNDGYVNPLEVFAGKVDEVALLNHIRESVKKCYECLKLETPHINTVKSSASTERYEAWQRFLDKWSVDTVSSLTLDNYTSFGGDRDSFCNWIEIHTDSLGSIWGGSAYKFGIFEHNPTKTGINDSTRGSDTKYAWYKKYGNSPSVVFPYVKDTILAIIKASQSGTLADIDAVDFGHAVKWKIAFLYQSMEAPRILPFYKKEMLVALTGMSKDTPTSKMQTKLMHEKPDDMDLFDYYDELLQRLPEKYEAEESENGTATMSKMMKSGKPTKYVGTRQHLSFHAGSKDDERQLRLLSALRAKPFAILAGHSGTGKSRYVKKLAYMTCNADELRVEGQLPGNYLLLQVKPNWHDSTDLLGFRNAMDGNRYQKTALIEFLFRAYHFKDTPFFLCLDEMNLAPVEQYFAEFLSAMESKEPVPLNDIAADEDNLVELGCEWADSLDYLKAKKFSIPKNLFIVGTVNMDETTNQFSRKVLDRAFTIEMTDVDFANFGKVTEPSYGDTIEEASIKALLNGEQIITKLDDEDTAEGSALVKVQKALEPTAFAIAYRFANEYTLLKRAFEVFDPDGTMKLDALDQAVLMKILPRIAGERDYIMKVYGELQGALDGKETSLKKIKDILKLAEDMNVSYVTFWP